MTHGLDHDGKNAARINGLNDDDSSAHDNDGDDSVERFTYVSNTALIAKS